MINTTQLNGDGIVLLLFRKNGSGHPMLKGKLASSIAFRQFYQLMAATEVISISFNNLQDPREACHPLGRANNQSPTNY